MLQLISNYYEFRRINLKYKSGGILEMFEKKKINECAKELKSNLETGLTEDEAKKRI